MLRRATTSLHRLNGDRGIGKVAGRLYSLLNIINNLFPYTHVDSRLAVRDFVVPDAAEYCRMLGLKSSPGRALSDLFWMTLPWERIEQELGRIQVVDTGCGSGGYAVKLLRWSGSRTAGYTGIDTALHADWAGLERAYPGMRFYSAPSSDLLGHVPAEANLFISQSAIEHFEHDLEYFACIRRFSEAARRPVLQIHLFPAAACRRLQGYHGIRQYTPRTVSKITRLFQGDVQAVLYRLGGAACKKLHVEFITLPRRRNGIDLRDTREDEYAQRLLQALRADMQAPQKSPVFFALLIHTNRHHSIF